MFYEVCLTELQNKFETAVIEFRLAKCLAYLQLRLSDGCRKQAYQQTIKMQRAIKNQITKDELQTFNKKWATITRLSLAHTHERHELLNNLESSVINFDEGAGEFESLKYLADKIPLVPNHENF
ncbi:MAG: hypothetical protein LW832_08740 [Parachlamydia sp.]|jgi:hypothetical protein|nr:hypothetical protein [Parachlamydia sp.]